VQGIVRPADPHAAAQAGQARAAVPNASSGIVVKDNGGAVLDHVNMHMIFWGNAWTGTPTPSATQVFNAMSSVVSGPYMTGLAQYRNIQPGVVSGLTYVNTPFGSSSGDPPNPFSDTTVQTLLSDLIFRGLIPTPSTPQILYCVVMPPGVAFGNPSYIGEHSSYIYYAFPLYWANVRYCWTTNSGVLDDVTTILSHELAEACTDPDPGSGFVVTAGCPGGGTCEIADVEPCHSTTQTVNGVVVQEYFSVQADGCIANKSAKDSKDGKDQKDGKQENKESKDSKDHKDGLKDAKEKERDAPEQGGITTPTVMQQLDAINRRLIAIEREITSGRTFIQNSERPAVGQSVLDGPKTGASGDGPTG
jgi:hypothetical protein